MRSDNMLMVHANNRYKAKNTTFEGELTSAENTYKAPIEVEVQGKSEQEVTVQGKNLWSLSSYYYAYTGVGFTSMDSGTFTLPINFHGTFTLSANITRYSDDVVTNPRISIKFFYTDGIYNIATGFFNSIPADGTEHFVYVTGTPDITKTIDHIGGWLFDYSTPAFRHIEARDIQLELGSTATAYAPFVPDSPSPDYPSDINYVNSGTRVNVCGKNFLDLEELLNNPILVTYASITAVDNTTGNVTVLPANSNTWRYTRYKMNLPDGNYQLSYDGISTVMPYSNTFYSEGVIQVIKYNSLGAFDHVVRELNNKNGKSLSFDIVNDGGFYCLGFYGACDVASTTPQTYIRVRITLVEDTSFVPYQLGGAALSEYGLYAGDNWSVESGEYEFDKAVLVLDGITNKFDLFQNVRNNRAWVSTVSNKMSLLYSKGNSKCSHFNYDMNTYYDAQDNVGFCDKDQGLLFRFGSGSSINTLDLANSWLAAQYSAGTPVTIVYQRATPLTVHGSAHSLNSLPRHTNVYSIPETDGLKPNIKTTIKTY